MNQTNEARVGGPNADNSDCPLIIILLSSQYNMKPLNTFIDDMDDNGGSSILDSTGILRKMSSLHLIE